MRNRNTNFILYLYVLVFLVSVSCDIQIGVSKQNQNANQSSSTFTKKMQDFFIWFFGMPQQASTPRTHGKANKTVHRVSTTVTTTTTTEPSTLPGEFLSNSSFPELIDRNGSIGNYIAPFSGSNLRLNESASGRHFILPRSVPLSRTSRSMEVVDIHSTDTDLHYDNSLNLKKDLEAVDQYDMNLSDSSHFLPTTAQNRRRRQIKNLRQKRQVLITPAQQLALQQQQAATIFQNQMLADTILRMRQHMLDDDSDSEYDTDEIYDHFHYGPLRHYRRSHNRHARSLLESGNAVEEPKPKLVSQSPSPPPPHSHRKDNDEDSVEDYDWLSDFSVKTKTPDKKGDEHHENRISNVDHNTPTATEGIGRRAFNSKFQFRSDRKQHENSEEDRPKCSKKDNEPENEETENSNESPSKYQLGHQSGRKKNKTTTTTTPSTTVTSSESTGSTTPKPISASTARPGPVTTGNPTSTTKKKGNKTTTKGTTLTTVAVISGSSSTTDKPSSTTPSSTTQVSASTTNKTQRPTKTPKPKPSKPTTTEQPQSVNGVQYLSTLNCTCGTQVVRSIGKKSSSKGSIATNPWLVTISTKDDHLCSASVVNNRYFLTSAACVNGIHKKHLVVTTGIQGKTSRRYTVSKIMIHPDFSISTRTNDIALIKVSKPVVFSDSVRPVCLPLRKSNESISRVRLVTWKTKPTDELQMIETDIRVISAKKCKSMLKRAFSIGNICATPPGQSRCGGDTGGIMQVLSTAYSYEQIGIVSRTVGCRKTADPGVYTDVGRHLNWILETAQDGRYCKHPVKKYQPESNPDDKNEEE